jgi:OOP family OmpA-OmpF porin
MKPRQVLCAMAGVGLLAGCSTVQEIPVVGGLFGGGQTAQAEAQPAAASDAALSPFERQLRAEYLQLASFERESMRDFPDAGIFAAKAAAVPQAGVVPPADPGEYDIEDQAALQELRQARTTLASLLDQGGRERAPYQAAVAQVRYDCWVEQQEEGWQTNDIRACRAMYYEAVDDLQAALAPAPQPRPQGAPQYLVFFDFDRAVLTPTAEQTIREIARNIQQGTIQQVDVVGYTDTVGPPSYNEQLSQARARAVQEGLAEAGVPQARINVRGRGEQDLLVPTPDGVREPSNRRAEILFR